MGAPALAQDTQPVQDAPPSETDGEVVVTGIRAALNKGLQTKRNADAIVDSISAEDIGKFPDNNIAEAIQRIPGVSIDRSGGEGRKISINGLGPEFSVTLLNGRQIASADAGRSFSFDTIAADIIGGINVYKTTTVDIAEGGMGGTIDVRTSRPFDFTGFRAGASLEYRYEDNSNKGDIQGTAYYSDRFMDGRLGVLLAFSHQKRHARNYFTQGGGWDTNYFVDPVEQAYIADDREDAWRTWNLQYGTTDSYRERNGGTIALQLQATDNLTLGVDYLYSKFKVKNVTNSGGAYLWAVQDSAQSIRNEDGLYTQLDVSGGYNLGSFSINKNITYRPTVTQAGGFNAKWEATDRLTANLDLSWSKAVTDNPGRDKNQALEMLNQPGYLVIFPEDGSSPSFDLKGVDLSKNASAFRARIVGDSGTYTKAENKEARADLSYKLTPDITLSGGVSYADLRKSNENFSTPTAITRMYHKNAEGQPIDVNSIILGYFDAGKKFGVTGTPFPVFQMDENALRAWMANPVNLANRTINANGGGLAEFIANGRTWNAVRNANSYEIREQDLGAYAQAKVKFDLGSVPTEIVAGVRYSRTDLTSSGSMRKLINFIEEVNNLQQVYDEAGATAVSVKHKYDEWLPSLNLKFELMPNMLLRLAASRTMTRPTLTQLAPAISYGGTSLIKRSAAGSNPLLEPFLAKNLDASWEWYYSRHGALAIAGFYKDAKNFIVNSEQNEIIDTVNVSPALQAKYPNINFQQFVVTRPRNAANGTVKGVTVSWTHALEMGLGLQANYTWVSSKVKTTGSDQFAIPGISDTANVVLFYEKGPIQARVAYNWRARNLDSQGSLTATGVYTTLPTSNDPYHQIDARLGFDVGWGVSVGLEAVNLTNEKYLQHTNLSNGFVGYNNQGRQFLGTVSKKF